METISVVRIKIAKEQLAPIGDSREFIGYREGLSMDELWRRGREAWRLRAEKVLACEYLVITHEGIIRAVGTIEGVRKVEGRADRLGIIGTPIPSHILIGRPDPLHNSSQNPISYGRIQLVEAKGSKNV